MVFSMTFHKNCPHCDSINLSYEPSEFSEYEAFYTCENCGFDFFVYSDGKQYLPIANQHLSTETVDN
jgi:transposase-like protein